MSKYLRYGHHEAIVVTLDRLQRPNPSAMGIHLSRDLVILRPYKRSRTFRNLVSLGEVTINLTNDSTLFFKSIYLKNEIRYMKSRHVKPPIIKGDVDLYIECRIREIIDEGDRVSFYMEVLDVYEGSGSKLSFSRANAQLIEALVFLTKMESLRGELSCNILSELLRRVESSISIAKRLGSDILKEPLNFIVSRARSIFKEYCGRE